MQFAGARAGSPTVWFDETRSPDGSVSSVHVGRQARTATGHGHLDGVQLERRKIMVMASKQK